MLIKTALWMLIVMTETNKIHETYLYLTKSDNFIYLPHGHGKDQTKLHTAPPGGKREPLSNIVFLLSVAGTCFKNAIT